MIFLCQIIKTILVRPFENEKFFLVWIFAKNEDFEEFLFPFGNAPLAQATMKGKAQASSFLGAHTNLSVHVKFGITKKSIKSWGY